MFTVDINGRSEIDCNKIVIRWRKKWNHSGMESTVSRSSEQSHDLAGIFK